MLITLIAWQCCSLGCFKQNNSWRELISNSLPVCLEERVCFCVIQYVEAFCPYHELEFKEEKHVLERRFLLLWSSNSFLVLEFLTVVNWKKLTYKWKWKLFSKFIWFFSFCLFQRLFRCQMWSLSRVFKEWVLEYLYCLIVTFKSNNLSWSSTIVLIDAHLD